jgi:hypothetical protein
MRTSPARLVRSLNIDDQGPSLWRMSTATLPAIGCLMLYALASSELSYSGTTQGTLDLG